MKIASIALIIVLISGSTLSFAENLIHKDHGNLNQAEHTSCSCHSHLNNKPSNSITFSGQNSKYRASDSNNTVWNCQRCGGNGRCYSCSGTGRYYDSNCYMCSGTGRCYYCSGRGRL
jgi:hypothetical protein